MDILANNPAAHVIGPASADMTAEQFDESVKATLCTLLWITRAAMPYLGPGAAVVNTASVQAYNPSHQAIVD